jgi:hypothetical protein
MDDLIGRLGANLGIDQAPADTSVAVIAQLLARQQLSENGRVLIRSAARHDPALKIAVRMRQDKDTFVPSRSAITKSGRSPDPVRTFARELASFPRQIRGTMRPAQQLAQAPSSARLSDV